jgi:hypothetical protein
MARLFAIVADTEKEVIMWNEPGKEILDKIPRLYETETIPVKEKLIYLHLFIGGCDWYIAEYDGDVVFWEFAILNGDQFNAEWGYIPFSELKKIKVKGGFEIDCEINWEPTRAVEIDKIQSCISHW